ncbi:DUF3800 domain-containing protein [Herbiconiux liangxiaofengii]|uniref:DUF3800 domain-containing protein n=1 Tax=Herbiconiux liangxiaofengii TaxID=3342795 RepID=UPI0035B6CC1E
MIYVDDSGHPQSGTAVYGWIEFSPDHWAGVLKAWLDTRKMLWREFGVPVVRELHTTDYVNGRGRIAKRVPDRHVHDGQEHWKDFGREVATVCLDTLRSIEGLTVGAVWRTGAAADLGRTRQEAYAALVTRFEAELTDTNSLAIVFMDGDGSDTSYRSTHRGLSLASRNVVEDAVHLESRTSQLVQMADLVAWSANAFVDHYPKNEFARDWYTTHLSERDRHRVPQMI